MVVLCESGVMKMKEDIKESVQCINDVHLEDKKRLREEDEKISEVSPSTKKKKKNEYSSQKSSKMAVGIRIENVLDSK